MILLYLIIITIVAFFAYKYIFGGREGIRELLTDVQQRAEARSQRRNERQWRKQFEANMVEIEEHWEQDHPRRKRQHVVVKGALKQFESAWTEPQEVR